MITSDKHIAILPIDSITVLNPRSRNKRIFDEVVSSIDDLGLKRPVTVTPRPDGLGYNLVCGQGRLEACKKLGETHIAATIIQASEEDCFVMSLVENLARRQHTPTELLRDIGALRQRGYTVGEIAKKTNFSDEYVSAICYLLDKGETRLLAAVDRGTISHTIAIEIARAKEDDVIEALLDAYEQKQLPGAQVLAIRKIIEMRRATGKGSARLREIPQKRVTAQTLVREFQRQVEKKKQMAEKARLIDVRMLFVTESLRTLLSDPRFRSLLRAQRLPPVPPTINARVDPKEDRA